MLRHWLRRRARPGGSGVASPAPASPAAPPRRRDWADLPTPNVVGARPIGVARARSFPARLAAATPPPRYLAPLGHRVTPEAPGGIAVGVARATQPGRAIQPARSATSDRPLPPVGITRAAPEEPARAAPTGAPDRPQPATAAVARVSARPLPSVTGASRPPAQAPAPAVRLPLRPLGVAGTSGTRQPARPSSPPAGATTDLPASTRPLIGTDPTGSTVALTARSGPDTTPRRAPGVGAPLDALPPGVRRLDQPGQAPRVARDTGAAGGLRPTDPADPPASRATSTRARPAPDRARPPVVARSLPPAVTPSPSLRPPRPSRPVAGHRESLIPGRTVNVVLSAPGDSSEDAADRYAVPVRWTTSPPAVPGDPPATSTQKAAPAPSAGVLPTPPGAARAGRRGPPPPSPPERTDPVRSAPATTGPLSESPVSRQHEAVTSSPPAPARPAPLRRAPAQAARASAPTSRPPVRTARTSTPPAATLAATEHPAAPGGPPVGPPPARANAPGPAAPPVTSTPAPAPVQRATTTDPPAPEPDAADEGPDVNRLFRDLYPRIRDELRWELRVLRERAGYLGDP